MKRKYKLLLSLLMFALLLCLCVGCNNSDNNSPRDDNTVIKPPKDDNTLIEPPNLQKSQSKRGIYTFVSKRRFF